MVNLVRASKNLRPPEYTKSSKTIFSTIILLHIKINIVVEEYTYIVFDFQNITQLC